MPLYSNLTWCVPGSSWFVYYCCITSYWFSHAFSTWRLQSDWAAKFLQQEQTLPWQWFPTLRKRPGLGSAQQSPTNHIVVWKFIDFKVKKREVYHVQHWKVMKTISCTQKCCLVGLNGTLGVMSRSIGLPYRGNFCGLLFSWASLPQRKFPPWKPRRGLLERMQYSARSEANKTFLCSS